MTDQLKPCPFCASEANLVVEDWVNPNGYGYGSGRTAYVRCLGCKAQGGFSSIDNFNMFSKYTVKDFRESNLLRAIEDERYEAYVEEQKNKAVSLWNGRAQLPEAPL